MKTLLHKILYKTLPLEGYLHTVSRLFFLAYRLGIGRRAAATEYVYHLPQLVRAGDVCIDIGASTGGFTDCMLQNGAAKVYAVDVGYGQLAWSLRTDPRVVNMERTNIRNVTPDQLDDPIAFFSVDVSFI